MKKIKANAALTIILILGSILLFGGLILVIATIDLAYTSKDHTNYLQNRITLYSCFEEIMVQIKENRNLLGNININVDGVQCSVNLAVHSASIKRVTMTISSENYNSTKVEYVDISGQSLELINNPT